MHIQVTESIIAQGGFKPSEVLVMPIEVIASNFEAGKLSAAAMWEPHARRQVELGNARYASTSAPWGEKDANFTSMRQDFIEKNPEAAAGWSRRKLKPCSFLLRSAKSSLANSLAMIKVVASCMNQCSIYWRRPGLIHPGYLQSGGGGGVGDLRSRQPRINQAISNGEIRGQPHTGLWRSAKYGGTRLYRGLLKRPKAKRDG